jgi:D-3-phosphoglycerate dehydrogenase
MPAQLRILIVGQPWSSDFAHVEGSPLEGAAHISRIDWDDSMTETVRAGILDAGLAEADGLLFAPWLLERIPAFTAERWSKAPHLKVIAGTFDNRFGGWLDIADAEARGVAVIDTSRSMTPTVAEFALAMTLNLLRDIPTAVQLVREGRWKAGLWDQPGFVFGDLAGKRVGLAGFGSINRRYAELLGPFQCSVAAHDPYVDDSVLRAAGIASVASVTALASTSEIFSIGIPPTPTTLGIISAEVINALPRGSLVVLTTRMAVVDQAALWRRAESGELRVAVDVFEPEPPPPQASIRRSPWIQPTPHIAGDTAYCHRRCFTTAAEDVLAVLTGRSPRYRATPHDQLQYQGELPTATTGATPDGE